METENGDQANKGIEEEICENEIREEEGDGDDEEKQER